MLVRKVIAFNHDDGELCAYAIEKFLITSIYGIFNLYNDTRGNQKYKDKEYYWISKPFSAFSNQENEQAWIGVAKRSMETGRIWPTDNAILAWIEIEPFSSSIRNLLNKNNLLKYISAGYIGQDVTAEWNIVNAPVRIQLKFSQIKLTVRFNFRPKTAGWNIQATQYEVSMFEKFITNKFSGSYNENIQLIKIAGQHNCFFKPYARDAEGNKDVDFYIDDSVSSNVNANWLPLAGELNITQALSKVLDFIGR